MMQITAQKRTIFGKKTEALRRQGLVPAVIYGGKDASEAVSVPRKDFMKLWKESGESTVINISVEGGGVKQALIQEVTFDPVKTEPVHVDFLHVSGDKKIKTHVALAFSGDSEAVKALGGVLVKTLHEVEVEALPKDLPHELIVDIAKLATFEDHILLKDITMPKGVTLIGDSDTVVAKVNPPRTDEELAGLGEKAEVDLESIEVAKKGKKEEALEAESEGE